MSFQKLQNRESDLVPQMTKNAISMKSYFQHGWDFRSAGSYR